jgi:hypothetical protein
MITLQPHPIVLRSLLAPQIYCGRYDRYFQAHQQSAKSTREKHLDTKK